MLGVLSQDLDLGIQARDLERRGIGHGGQCVGSRGRRA
jgi:hypothetical protein